MSESSSRLAFTATQWQELEHQALIFKYMVSGLPIPPDLLVPLKKSLDFSSLSANLIHHQPQNVGWNYFQMGFGRKFDPEPGRCRRTDGKKWRCSKEAYPDSKYCERHMHRGRNRSRKPVEIITNQTTKSTTNNPSKSLTPTSIPISPISKNPHPSLDNDYGYGNVRSYSRSSMDDPWQMTQNVMVGSSLAHSKQRNCSVLKKKEPDQFETFKT
ncbi:hypothetical protein Vadar_017441 [Vaccinium darrowii]|uniref:Uncharacterized protein n=1 Tax=Vaccinium darrowii TaxID=229202 RepID=A0ACB7YGA8_9ERIC|nr:hypothetical protein Vadar_017441 [Vaccinium darrowii]